ncbi:MAG: hypothetical protein HYR92_01535 [Burkholderiales bacterium]|nr:hypothetical protein [Burkholderiales bacterium]
MGLLNTKEKEKHQNDLKRLKISWQLKTLNWVQFSVFSKQRKGSFLLGALGGACARPAHASKWEKPNKTKQNQNPMSQCRVLIEETSAQP